MAGSTRIRLESVFCSGKVIGRCYSRHRAGEFLKFLRMCRVDVNPVPTDVLRILRLKFGARLFLVDQLSYLFDTLFDLPNVLDGHNHAVTCTVAVGGREDLIALGYRSTPFQLQPTELLL